MSLFGTSPDARPSKIKSSLFDDETPSRPSPKQTASGLFADSTNDDGDSPWGFISPRKQSRGNPVKTLLPATEVPESYIDAYDALLESGERTGSGLSLSTIKRLLAGTGLGSGAQSEILRIVLSGQDGSAGFGRAEFNVLLALVGLAQEGEEATLDGVDERRRRLPQPRLPQLRAPKPPPQRTESEQPPAAPTPAPPAPAMRAQSFGYTDSDPWATSPPISKPIQSIDAVENGATSSNGPQSTPVPQRTTSTFTTTAEDVSTSLPPPPPIETSTGQGNDGWGVYNGSSGTDFAASGGFGDSPIEDRSRQVPIRSSRAVGGGSNANQRVEELVIVETLQEKEGMFLFQHRNYEVSSTRRNSKVIRRYSDFVWLLDCLHKRYPFRQLPLLPPKRVAINGNHIASDNLFIEKRRRGLARFANALVRHPVLNQEQLVIMFLTVPTELAVWRKQATITVQEEFVGKALPPTLEESLPPTLEDLFQTVRTGVRRSTEIYINLCVLLERLIKRKEGLGSDYTRLSSTLQLLTEASPDTYKIDSNDVPLLNEGIQATAKHISTHHSLLQDEGRAWGDGVLEDLKRQRDGLVSMRDMFDRRDRFAKDNIPQLERRIANNENKLAGARAKAEGMRKPGEIEKLEESIFKDKDSILQQHARGVFIKECLRDEILSFQSSQYHVSRTHQDWAQERVKYAELVADNWRGLAEEVEGMPGGE